MSTIEIPTPIKTWSSALFTIAALVALVIVQSPIWIAIVLLFLGAFGLSGGYRCATLSSLMVFDIALGIWGFEHKGEVMWAGTYPQLLAQPSFWPDALWGRPIQWAPGFTAVLVVLGLGGILQYLVVRLWRQRNW